MSVVLLALLAGCLFYIVRTGMEFQAFEVEHMPRLDELERKIGKLCGMMDAEAPALEEVRARVVALRASREEILRQMEEVKGALQAEKSQGQALAIEVQKRVFRGTLARGRKLALR